MKNYGLCMIIVGLSLIWVVHSLILFSMVARLNLGNWVENRNMGSFDELDRARQTTRRFALCHHLTLNLMLKVMLDYISFRDKHEIAERIGILTKDLLFSPCLYPCILCALHSANRLSGCLFLQLVWRNISAFKLSRFFS